MPTFRTKLVSGTRPPYETWAFAVVPERVMQMLGGTARIEIRGTLAGIPFQSTIQKGDGVYRFAVKRAVRDAAGVSIGETVEISVSPDTTSRELPVPLELREVLSKANLARAYAGLPPAHRRAWAQHVAEAKQASTRLRRARRAIEGIRGKLFPGQVPQDGR